MDRLSTPRKVRYLITLLPTIHVLVISLAEVGEEGAKGLPSN